MRTIQPTVVRYSTDMGLYSYMLSIYRYMGLGLALTGALAMGYGFLPLETRKSLSFLPQISAFGTFGIAMLMSFTAQKMRVSTAQMLFWLYSAFMGLTMAGILPNFTPASVGKTFIVTACAFGGLTAYGHVTRRDLSSLGSFAVMGLFGLIAASLMNLFFKSTGLQFAISLISVAVFSALIAFDTQRLKEIYYSLPADKEIRQKMSIFGALNLYTSVINLFLSLLQIFGERRDS